MKHVRIGTKPSSFQKLRRRAATVFAIALLAVVWVAADAPPGPYFNGFEINTAGWFTSTGGTITRVPSGSSSTYANGVMAATGGYYARLGKDTNPDSCTFGGGTANIFYGPFTRWGGYSSIFPPGGYQTGVDIYLDVPYAQTHLDTRFDWSSAINKPDGSFLRDFVFNVGTDLLGFVITGGNNSTRCSANPSDAGHSPVVHIATSGWYTFRHTFTGVSGGPLIVILEVMPSGSMVPLGTWVRSDPSDIIGVTVGGNRYGWFVQNEFDGLAIDNSFRTGIVSTPNCELKISDGGSIIALNGDLGTFGGNAKVSSSGTATGHQEYHDHGPLQPITVNTIDVTAVTCSNDRTQASIFGHATIDGEGSFEYEIDLTDNGEPGVADKYRIFIPGIAYESGSQTLQGGNIQIR